MSDDFDYIEEIKGICESVKRNRFNLTPEMILCEMTYLEERLSLASARDVASLQKAREGVLKEMRTFADGLDNTLTNLNLVTIQEIAHGVINDFEKLKGEGER